MPDYGYNLSVSSGQREVIVIYLTVRSMVEQCGFSDFVVHAGMAGLDAREVRTVCVIDTVDIEGWVFGGEFLLSSGYIFKDEPERLSSVIEAANKAGAAALGVKMERYIGRIPHEVLRVADALSFPLIGIPLHYTHTDIINRALRAVSNKKTESLALHGDLGGEFFEALLEGSTIESLMSLLQRNIHRDVLFVDASTGTRTTASDSAYFARGSDESPIASLIENLPHEEILLSGKTAGYLFFDSRINSPASLEAIDRAKQALRLHLRWESERWKIERGRGALFVQDILFKRFRHDSEIMSRGKALGWDLDGAHAIVLASVDGDRSAHLEPHEPHSRAYETLHSMLRGLQPTIPHTTLEDSAAFIMRVHPENWKRTRARLTDVFRDVQEQVRLKTGLHLMIGVGSPVENMLSCDRSYWEAKRALSIARERADTALPFFWEEMGVYKLLAPMIGTPEASDFVVEQLAPLIGSDRPAADSLLATLFCVIANNWQLKPVADEMTLHYNTVKYRYRKIGDTLGVDLDSPAARMNLAMAMELYLLGQSERRSTKDDN